ncbi:hypothetical protein H5410_055138 [Solanum commersonii]|uniref:Uncharacterized protein n=1 Tax=Solanum commersonii TaxID=4109 RepID=A0A9J5WIG4_SOLCO|nr:hypothetical protein H5410_055138 [Solanum commersonii]
MGRKPNFARAVTAPAASNCIRGDGIGALVRWCERLAMVGLRRGRGRRPRKYWEKGEVEVRQGSIRIQEEVKTRHVTSLVYRGCDLR